MPDSDPQPDTAEDPASRDRDETVARPEADEEADKRLDDLDPEEEEAADVQGGQRTFGRYGRL